MRINKKGQTTMLWILKQIMIPYLVLAPCSCPNHEQISAKYCWMAGCCKWCHDLPYP